jgi:hypothetical protein
MKAIHYLVSSIFILYTGLLSAQKPIMITEDSVTYGEKKYPGIVVYIPEVGFERTEKNWIKELQAGTKSTVVSENGELLIFGANVKEISPNPLNIYSRVVQDSILQLQVSFELKKDQFIEKAQGDAELIAARKYLKQFAKSQYVDFVMDEVRVEDRKLKDLTNALSSLQNEKSRKQRSIQSNQANIIKEKDDIVLKNNEVNTVNAEILTQNNLLETMEEGAARVEKATYIKELEKRKKKLLNDIESSENRISRANNEIRQAERDIPVNESEQGALKIKISEQEGVLKTFTDKLAVVKGY